MRSRLVARAAATVVTVSALLPGCILDQLIEQKNVLGLLALLFTGSPGAKPGPVKAELTLPIGGSIGGLSGTYSLTFGTYGPFEGTGKIGKNQKSVTVTAIDSPQLRAFGAGIIKDALGIDVAVTSASGKIKGKQTTGGVKKSWNGNISFEGTISAGPGSGQAFKCKVKSKGSF